jgi:hypothetical protein
MAEIKITVTAAQKDRLIAAYGQGYQEQVYDNEVNELVDNPQSKPQFALTQLLTSMKSRVLSHEREEAAKAVEENPFEPTIG